MWCQWDGTCTVWRDVIRTKRKESQELPKNLRTRSVWRAVAEGSCLKKVKKVIWGENYVTYSVVLFATYMAKWKDIWPTTDLVRKVKKKKLLIHRLCNEGRKGIPSNVSAFYKGTVGDGKEIAGKLNKFLPFIFIAGDERGIPAPELLFFW